MNKGKNIIISAVGLALVGGVVYAGASTTGITATPAITIDDNATKEVMGTTPAPTAQTASASTGTQAPASAYKDGTYSATGTYDTPESTESVNVTLTLKNGVVNDASVSFGPTGSHQSSRYQQMFAANYKQYVIGKDLSTLNLTRVSGSSLTPMGFDAAVEKIKSQAQA